MAHIHDTELERSMAEMSVERLLEGRGSGSGISICGGP
jgi:hypothetical protein